MRERRAWALALAIVAASALGPPARADAPPSEIDLVEGYHASFQGFDDPAGPRSGTRGGAAVHRWFADRLADAGLTPRFRSFDFPRFVARHASLAVDGGGGSSSSSSSSSDDPTVFPLYYSGSTGPDGVEARLVDVGAGTAAEFAATDVAGAIAVIHSPYTSARPQTLDGAIVEATSRSALALVAAIDGPGNDIPPPNTPARPELGALPVLLIGWEDGESLRAEAGRIATFVLDASIEPGAAFDTYAVIPGQRPEVVIVGTPLNGWFSVATERGSGVAVLLEVARRSAARAADSPPMFTTVFVGLGGHEVEAGGLTRFLGCFDAAGIVSYVHLGATVAAKTAFDVGGEVVAAEVNDPRRAIYVSENPLLQALVVDAFGPHTTGQALRPSPGGVANPGEQADAYALGIPIVAISGNSYWFHTVHDTPDRSAQSLLAPMSDAFDRLVRSLHATDASTMRSANALADGRAAHPPSEPCPPETADVEERP